MIIDMAFPSFLDLTKFFLHFYFKLETMESSNYLMAVEFFKATSNTKDTLPENHIHQERITFLKVYFSLNGWWLKVFLKITVLSKTLKAYLLNITITVQHF